MISNKDLPIFFSYRGRDFSGHRAYKDSLLNFAEDNDFVEDNSYFYVFCHVFTEVNNHSGHDKEKKENQCYLTESTLLALQERGILEKVVYWSGMLHEKELINIDTLHLSDTGYWRMNDFIQYTYGDDYNQKYLDELSSVVDNVDKTNGEDFDSVSDLIILLNMKNFLISLRGHDIFTFSQWMEIWRKNKKKFFEIKEQSGEQFSLLRDLEDISETVDSILKNEYLQYPYEKLDNKICFRKDFNIVNLDSSQSIFANSFDDFKNIVEGFNSISEYYLSNKWENDFDHSIWDKGEPIAYQRMLFSTKVLPTPSAVTDLMNNKSAIERYALCNLGSHIMKNDKYFNEIIRFVENSYKKNPEKLKKTRIASKIKGKTRIFNDKFILSLLGITSLDKMHRENQERNRNLGKPDDYIEINSKEDLAKRIVKYKHLSMGSINQSFVVASKMNKFVHDKKIVNNLTDINYIVALLINSCGVHEGILRLVEATEQDSGEIFTVPQWERYVKEYETLRDIPFEIGMELVSRSKK